MLKARTENPGIRTAIDVLKEMSLSKMIKAEWDYRQKQWRDRRAREGFVYDQGKAEGKTEGKTEAVDVLSKNLKLSLEESCRAIGISVEEYMEIKGKSGNLKNQG